MGNRSLLEKKTSLNTAVKRELYFLWFASMKNYLFQLLFYLTHLSLRCPENPKLRKTWDLCSINEENLCKETLRNRVLKDMCTRNFCVNNSPRHPFLIEPESSLNEIKLQNWRLNSFLLKGNRFFPTKLK